MPVYSDASLIGVSGTYSWETVYRTADEVVFTSLKPVACKFSYFGKFAHVNGFQTWKSSPQLSCPFLMCPIRFFKRFHSPQIGSFKQGGAASSVC